MSRDSVIKVTMELLSDAILGSGQSIPGGEDIGVLKDSEGYPYFKGETFKGLLRESLENYCVWTGRSQKVLDDIMGESGWNGNENSRHIHITPLMLEGKPLDPDTCFSYRAFTSIEDGVIKDKTLRMAAVVNRGLKFSGEIECSSEDEDLLLKALSGIKYLGTMRSRGFGNVKITGKPEKKSDKKLTVNNAGYMYLRLKTMSPLIITDLQISSGNNLDVRGYISGSAIRGTAITALANSDSSWFEKNKANLLSDKTRFLDLIPVCGDYTGIPSIKGFYEDKKEENDPDKQFESIVVKGEINPEDTLKRAGLGTFCAIDDNKIVYWNAEKTSSTRINRASLEREIFQTVSLDAGQEFEGYIYTDNVELSRKIADVFKGTIWVGADRHSGYGKCIVEEIKSVDKPEWINKYGYEDDDKTGKELYMMAISPFSMVDEYGELCGVNTEMLAEGLGIKSVEIDIADTTVVEYNTYNSTWGCRDASITMYDRGSLFKLECDSVPSIDKLREIEHAGLGIRAAEGFGQVLFLKPSLLEKIKKKHKVNSLDNGKKNGEVMDLRRAKINWILDNVKRLGVGNNKFNQISKSQLGYIQALCEKDMALISTGKAMEPKSLYEHLDKNTKDRDEGGRGVRQEKRFATINKFIRGFLNEDLSTTLGVSCENTYAEKLRLLCKIFDFSRKEG